MSQLVIKNLVKKIHDKTILADISLTATSGQVVALLGHSGSGKTTLLRCLNYLEQPDAGTITLDGLRLNQTNQQAWRKKVGMVFQQYHLWPHLNVLENVTMAPRLVNGDNLELTQARARGWLAKLGLLDKITAYPSQLSGGQQQRVAIARALIMRPRVLLMDEPISALDPQTIQDVQHILATLRAEGYLIFISSHNTKFVAATATHVLFLHQGRLLEQGEQATLYNNPQSPELAAFLETL